jgi:hypothetical protein
MIENAIFETIQIALWVKNKRTEFLFNDFIKRIITNFSIEIRL